MPVDLRAPAHVRGLAQMLAMDAHPADVLETWEAATVGARFHPTLARCQRLDSHRLRAHCTIKRPRVSTDHLVRQTMLQRHDDSPPGKPDAGDQARPDCGVPSESNCSSAIFRDPSFVCLIQ